ncbi:MAG: alpha/beta hydrolase [Cyanobacteria bacterium J06597_1]
MSASIPYGFSLQYAQTSLGRMAYFSNDSSSADADKERPTLLFLHGFGGGASSYEWSKVYPAFASTYRVVAPDLLGWGQSEHPQRSYAVEDYLLTLREFIQGIGAQPVIAIASTLSAAFIVRIATQHPDWFDSLFLVCPSGFQDFGKPAGRRIPLPIINTPGLDLAIYALGATNEIAVTLFLERFVFAERDRISPEVVNAYLTSAQQPNAEYAALSFLRGDLNFDLAEYAPKLEVPTAIAWGQKSQFISPELGRRLVAQNPSYLRQFDIVPDAGIFPHLELPAAIISLILSWVERAGE